MCGKVGHECDDNKTGHRSCRVEVWSQRETGHDAKGPQECIVDYQPMGKVKRRVQGRVNIHWR